MREDNVCLTPAEWNLMECLWEKSPRTGREAVEDLQARVGWNRSTTLTMLRRMTDKGILSCEKQEGVMVYAPRIRREDAAIRETESFLDRVYKGSVSLMMSALTKKQELSREEIDQLYRILKQAEEGKQDD